MKIALLRQALRAERTINNPVSEATTRAHIIKIRKRGIEFIGRLSESKGGQPPSTCEGLHLTQQRGNRQ